MSEPERLEFSDGARRPRPSWCGGAVLLLGIDEFRTMARNGVRWSTGESVFRASLSNGRGTARVHCTAEAMDGYALCASCSAHEANYRRLLRERQGAQR